ncbi:MAG: phosphoglycerate kinase, partial [Clostridia bacterium]|nr:phosphoglycerate kinase [Clostridia bacterium]
MYNKKTIEDIEVSGKRVLVRCDFNVPLKDGVITSDKRIVSAIPTIKYLLDKGAKVILTSHMGKPHAVLTEGFGLTKKEKAKVEALPAEEQAAAKAKMLEKAAKEDPINFTLKPVADRLNELLGGKVAFAKDIIGEDAKAKVAALKDGEAVLLENVRFDARETKNDPAFSKALAEFADLYVNDAFGSAHRAHSSTAGVTEFIKEAACGYLIQKEIKIMGDALSNPARPFVAILGGAKVSDKIGVINNLIEKVDTLIIGGGMAYTFFRALGYEIGTSICEEDKIELASGLLAKAKEKGVNFLLPVDNIVATEYKEDAEHKYVPSDNIPEGWMGLDIGPNTRELFANAIAGAGTVVWNGPMGVSEWKNFAAGTE